eukprot:Em0011g348a
MKVPLLFILRRRQAEEIKQRRFKVTALIGMENTETADKMVDKHISNSPRLHIGHWGPQYVHSDSLKRVASYMYLGLKSSSPGFLEAHFCTNFQRRGVVLASKIGNESSPTSFLCQNGYHCMHRDTASRRFESKISAQQAAGDDCTPHQEHPTIDDKEFHLSVAADFSATTEFVTSSYR